MIKPEAMAFNHEIRGHIERSLAVVAIKPLLLPSWAIDVLYDDLTDELRSATNTALSEPVELGLVQGDDAVRKMLEIAGENTKPSECHPDSLRYRYGIWKPVMLSGTQYYKNAIHRPKTDDEAALHIDLFGRLE
jgi:hypothetical protein